MNIEKIAENAKNKIKTDRKNTKGSLGGLNQKNTNRIKKQVESNKETKINRSYMISKATLSKLQELKIKNPARTFSDIVEESIDYYYKDIKK